MKEKTWNAAQRRNFVILLALAVIVFALYAGPNAKASENIAMVQVFNPDEAEPLPYVFHMIQPGENLAQTLKNFIFYDYYPYGFVYFAYSAIVLVPLQWLGQLQNIPLVMLTLRQMVSVLPMLAALLLLVYLQDGFRTYRSIVLFAFLASIPAVVGNNLWWHPDGLATFLVALTLFLLVRDRLRLGRNFYFAAVTCGLTVATKLIGVYFFLAVGLVLTLAILQKTSPLWKVIKSGLFFLLLMMGTYLIASPFLLSHWERAEFLMTMSKQSAAISSGYGIVYEKGLLAAWPIVHQFYGELIFLLLCAACMIWGIFCSRNKLLFGILLAWFIPLSIMVFFLSHFKFQYWMPAALPMISCIAIIFPDFAEWKIRKPVSQWFNIGLVLIVLVQFGLFAISGTQAIKTALQREENEPAIQTYDEMMNSLKPVEDLSLFVYKDPRVYFPPIDQWNSTTTYDLLSYDYIQENKFDVLILMNERIRDYLNPSAIGINPADFAQNQRFYRDADEGTVMNYPMIFENDFAKIFVREDLYQEYFQGN